MIEGTLPSKSLPIAILICQMWDIGDTLVTKISQMYYLLHHTITFQNRAGCSCSVFWQTDITWQTVINRGLHS